MTQKVLQPDPVCVSDERLRDTVVPLFIALLIFAVAVISASRFGLAMPLTSLQVLVLIPLGCVFLIFSGYVFLRSRKLEFYEGFVRILPRRGRVMEVPYSHVRFQLKELRGRTGVTELGELSFEGETKLRLTLSDVKMEKPDTTLFQWLPTKVGPSASAAYRRPRGSPAH
ncbi:MAG: hypothetical protein OK449_10400 [Thaumarchaeota archaeon]|jgi:hypothetical protein|nr:hypothetical protein [Nitrososphaerota archaeon]